MLSLNTRFATITPAQYHRINQVSLLILIGSAAIAPAWVNIIVSAGYALMNWLTFKRMVISIIDRVLSDIPGQPAAPARRPSVAEIQAARWDAQDAARGPRPTTGNTHRYYGAGDLSRPARHGKRIDRQFRKGRS